MENAITETKDPADARYEFGVAIGFTAPQEGIVTVFARDAEHAKEVVREQFKNRPDLVIADVFDMNSIRQALPVEGEATSLN